jgi:twitching motility protein PilT
MATLLDRINEGRAGHILTLEDPIEFVHQSKRSLVNQREVGTHTPSFVEGLRAALRADPDVIFTGQLREPAAIEVCLEIAETGHLVFGALHTTSAASTVERIVDLFPAERRAQIQIMLADCLRAIVVQTLCKRVGGGRIAAFEIFLNTPAARNLLRDGKTFQIPAMLQSAKNQGMTSLTDSLLEHVRAGIVEPREAYLKATDKSGLVSGLRSLGIPFPQDSIPVPAGADDDGAAAHR